MITDDAIVRDILRRELHPSEKTWTVSRARKHSADRGGWTRGGITADSWGQYQGWSRAATRAELDAVSEDQALAFYRRRHVSPFDAYPNPLRLLLIDFGVTSTHLAVFRALQQALRDLGLYDGQIDGIAGSKTKAAVAMCPEPIELYLRTLEYRARHYVALSLDAQVRDFLKTHPTTQLHNMRGWLKRCLEFVYVTEVVG